ncbi:LacI family DNA-binding transcriptional regulator [Mariniluteicoccus flavus]
MPGRATIYEVAREAGVSASTVSRAFNAPHLLLAKTVQRVHEVAERLGYVPNRHAQALTTGRTGILGLVVPDLVNPFFPPLIRAAQRAAEAYGLNVMVVETNSDAARERRHVASLLPHCEGLVMASPRLPSPELQQVAGLTRLVLINNDTDEVARVLLSTSRAVREGVAHFAAQGAKRFTYVGGPHRSWSQHERRGAVEEQTRSLGLEVDFLQVEAGTYAQARSTMAERAPASDAIIAFDDIIACGVLDGLGDAGRDVPRDVRLLGCDDALPVSTRPRISTIHLPTAIAVQEAVGMLAESEGSTVVDQRVVHEGELRMRET